MPFTLQSPAFHNGGEIPRKYTRSGLNVSPPLEWKDAPKDTKSFALIVEDPDAPSGMFRHWAVFDIDRQRSRLAEGATDHLHNGVNDFGNRFYDGPQPPRGHGVHHYRFRLAALDTEALDLPEATSAANVWKAAQPHVLAEADLVGTFESR